MWELLVPLFLQGAFSVTCNTKMCPSDLKGNGVCNFECMIDGCNYDSKSGWRVEDGDCYNQCVTNTMGQCDAIKLGNTQCDDGCNVPECGWDNGYCTSCASGCSIDMMYNDVLDSSCNVMGCLFDFMKGKCDSTCWSTKMGNGACNTECMLPSCTKDSSTGNIENSECLSACYSAAPTCTLAKLQNTSCDSECNIQACAFDNGRCGFCASDCFLNELRDGNDASAGCNTSAFCGYDDDFDQGCQKSRSYRCYNTQYGNGTCNPTCGLHFECNLDNGDCKKCNSDPLAYYLPDGTCQCQIGKYIDSNRKCTGACRTNCDVCTTGEDCVQCSYSNPYYTYNFVTSTCTCSGTNTEIKNGKCLCSKGYYATSLVPLVCSGACAPDCATCNTATYCETCTATGAVPAKTGGCECSAGYYTASSNPISCIVCDSSCATCSNATSCITCKNSFMTIDATTGLCVCPTNSSISNDGSTCVCNDGYYDADSSTAISCTACDTYCKTCINGTTCSVCKDTFAFTGTTGDSLCDCATGTTLNAAGTACECSTGLYVDPVSYTCTACLSDCITCTTGTTCKTCQSSFEVPSTGGCDCPANSTINNDGSGCTCNDGYFQDGTSIPITCTACDVSCQTCTNASACLTCKTTFLTPVHPSTLCTCPTNSSPNSAGTECVCNSAYYDSDPSASVVSCLPCDDSCATCNDGTTCTRCINFSMTPGVSGCTCPTYSTLSSGLCECDAGYYDSDTSSGVTCTGCDSSCQTCTSDTACTVCKAPYSFLGTNAASLCGCPDNSTLNLAGSACVCYDGFYDLDSGASALCAACHSSCDTCSDGTTCITCKYSYMVPATVGCECPTYSTLSVLSPGCVCDAGYYDSDNSSAVVCLQCDVMCETCSDGITCDTCKDTFEGVDVSGQCYCTNDATYNPTTVACECNSGYYNSGSLTAVLCDLCISKCLSCTTSTDCTQCEDTFYYDSTTSTCTCPANSQLSSSGNSCECITGYYDSDPSSAVLNCQACYIHCLTCDAALTCLTCKTTFSAPDSTTGCTCPNNAEPNSSNNACECSDGYYNTSTNPDIVTCSPCYDHCATCTNSTKCLTCKDSSLIPSSTQGCKCPTGKYDSDPDPLVVSCVDCNFECATCNQAEICSKCKLKYATVNPTQGCDCPQNSVEDYTLSSCVCKDGYYNSSSKSLECEKCSDNCETCSSYAECLSCYNSMEIVSGSCIYTCESGYYGTKTGCYECDKLCKECTRKSSNCQSCVLNASLNSKNECVCNSGYIQDALGCKAKVNGDISYDISVLSSNEIGLYFNVPPYFDTSAENYVVTIDGKPVTDFELVKIDENNYKIIVNGVEIDPNNTKIDVSLKNPLDSSTIYMDDLEHEEEEEEDDELPNYIEAGLPYIIFGLFLLGLCPWLFTGTWLTINSLQILTYIPLMDIELSSLSYNFLQALNKYNIIPNLFNYFLESDHSTYQILDRYGFDTPMFLKNCGSFMVILLILPILTLIVFLLRLLPQCKSFSKKLTYTFYHYTYLRFTIESALPMGLLGVVQAIYVRYIQPSMEDASHGINSILGYVFIILGFVYPVVYSRVIYRNYRKASTDDITVRRWFLLFEGYETREKLSQFLFYPLFFIRRILYVAILIGLKDHGYVQIALNITHSALFTLYVILFNPFIWKSDQILNIIVESINTTCFVLLIFYQIDIDKNVLDVLDLVIIILGITVIVCGFIQAILKLFHSINKNKAHDPLVNTDSDMNNTQSVKPFDDEEKGPPEILIDLPKPMGIGMGQPFTYLTSPEHKKCEMGFFSRINKGKQDTLRSP